ncbi:hypothetical protein PT974_02102 [Cladobotryum mycophilum]|uniref:Protein kinase domain-containing protein n=1 Tax=Cladobotryum mycophilum TaxID=491253 RepID=A0ABR0SX49_9HYPO
MEAESVDAQEPLPSYCMLDLAITGQTIHYAFMYNGKRFYVTISADKLQGRGGLLDEFAKFAMDLDDLDTMFQFEDWVLDALDGFISEVAPAAAASPEPELEARKKPITLLDFLGARRMRWSWTRIVDQPSLPDLKAAAAASGGSGKGCSNGSHILRSELPNVPCIYASELERIDDGPGLLEFSDVPKKVRRIGTDQVFFFKGGFKYHLREMQLLDQVNQRYDMFVPPFRTSRLVGLVLWDDDDDGDGSKSSSLMGFLLEYIGGDTLARRVVDAHTDLKMKWISEVEVTLRRLHEVGIIWGAVTPENVIINQDGHAVIVDLGVGYTPEYIKPEDQQTVRGDMLGLEHMRTELGLIDRSLYSAASGH